MSIFRKALEFFESPYELRRIRKDSAGGHLAHNQYYEN